VALQQTSGGGAARQTDAASLPAGDNQLRILLKTGRGMPGKPH